MHTRNAGALASLAAAFALTGCATIFTGTTDTLTFHASVPGVRLYVDGQYVGELPLTMPMSRNFVGGKQFFARFEKEGFVTQEFRLHREFNAVAILDVTSIPTSGGIDLLTGSLMKFAPTQYHVQMLPLGQSAASAEFQRETAIYRYVLTNYPGIQKDLARGGGEHLEVLAFVLCGGRGAASALASEETLRNAAALLCASSPHDLVARLDRMLAASAALRAYRI